MVVLSELIVASNSISAPCALVFFNVMRASTLVSVKVVSPDIILTGSSKVITMSVEFEIPLDPLAGEIEAEGVPTLAIVKVDELDESVLLYSSSTELEIAAYIV